MKGGQRAVYPASKLKATEFPDGSVEFTGKGIAAKEAHRIRFRQVEQLLKPYQSLVVANRGFDKTGTQISTVTAIKSIRAIYSKRFGENTLV